MKKIFTTFLILVFILGLIPINFIYAQDLSSRLKGKILLQVESNGEAWYIYPDDLKRYYLGRPGDAFSIMRNLGLGISERDYNSFYGYAPSRLSGGILLRVEANGEAYYVNPDDLKMYYLGRPADAFQIMRELGLGISNNDIGLIDIKEGYEIVEDWKVYQNEEYGFEMKYPKDWETINRDWIVGREYVQFTSPLINNKYYFALNFGARNKGDNTQISYQTDENWELLKSFMRLGDKVKIGSVDVLTTEIVDKGKVHSILYSNRLGAGRVEISDLEIQADSGIIEGPQHLSTSDVESIDFKNLLESKLANQILSTFKFLEEGESEPPEPEPIPSSPLDTPMMMEVLPSQTSITISSPNGGEVWEVGNSYTIFWESTAITDGLTKVNIKLLSQQVGVPSSTYHVGSIASEVDVAKGFYQWLVPAEMKGPGISLADYPCHKIEVVDSRYGRDSTVLRVISDESDGCFRIEETCSLPETPVLTDPGVSVNNGESFTLNWTSVDGAKGYWFQRGYVSPIPSDPSWYSELNSVTQTFSLGDSTTFYYRVNTCNDCGCSPWGNVVDIRVLVPSITVTSPNGGEEWIIGNNYEISWSCKNISESRYLRYLVKIQLLQDGFLYDHIGFIAIGGMSGYTYHAISDGCVFSGTNSYSWPAGSAKGGAGPGDNFQVKVELTDLVGAVIVSDINEGSFSIVE